MASAIVTIIFQNSYATPVIKLLIRVTLRSLLTAYRINMKFCIVTNLKMANTKMEFFFQISYATPIIRLLIRLISELKINLNYLSDLNEMFHTKQLKSGKYNSDSYFFKFLMPRLS